MFSRYACQSGKLKTYAFFFVKGVNRFAFCFGYLSNSPRYDSEVVSLFAAKISPI